jgi:hypothetical protein
VSANDAAPRAYPRPGPGCRDPARADLALATVNGALGRARRLHAGKPARLAVLGVYRELARGYHAGADPMLFEVLGALVGLLGRWADPGEAPRERWWQE